MRKALASLAVCCALVWRAPAQDDGQSLGDLARQVRQQRATEAAQADQLPQKVYTNQDIPKWTDDVTWKSSPASAATTSVNLDPRAGEHPVQVKRQDVECSFFFRAQDLLPAGRFEDSGVRVLPASDVARLAGTGSIWGDKFDISIHNDTGWQLREVTVRLLTGSDGAGVDGNSRQAEHAVSDPATNAGRVLSMQLNADPFSAAISTKNLGIPVNSGEKWSWEIVQAKGIPPKRDVKN